MVLRMHDNPSPSLLLVEGDPEALAENAAAGQRRLAVGTDHLLYLVDEAGVKTQVGGASGAVATDAIWDAAGDLAVGTGANTAAKLAIGAAGGHVSRINGAVAWDSGTSFPTAATGDRYWRTDLGLPFFYDGTRWKSLQLFTTQMLQIRTLPTPYSATTTGAREAVTPHLQGGSDVWLENARCAFHIAGGTALSASHKWTGTITKVATALGETTLATITIDSGSLSVYRETDVAIGALLRSGTAYFAFWENWTKTGTPGNLTAHCSVTYRIVAT